MPTTRSTRNQARIDTPSKLMHRASDLRAPDVKRVCSQCGFKDTSPIPPTMCPKCHWQPEGNPTLAQAVQTVNRKERRQRARLQRLEHRKTQKKIDRETGGTGKYEAS